LKTLASKSVQELIQDRESIDSRALEVDDRPTFGGKTAETDALLTQRFQVEELRIEAERHDAERARDAARDAIGEIEALRAETLKSMDPVFREFEKVQERLNKLRAQAEGERDRIIAAQNALKLAEDRIANASAPERFDILDVRIRALARQAAASRDRNARFYVDLPGVRLYTGSPEAAERLQALAKSNRDRIPRIALELQRALQ